MLKFPLMSSKQKQRAHKKKKRQTQSTEATDNPSITSSPNEVGGKKGYEDGSCKMNRANNTVPAKHRTVKGLEPIDKFTLVIAFFTAILAFTSGFQVWAFIQSEKPIIGITDIRLTDEFKATQNGRLIIEIKNTGKTTAFISEFKLYGDGGMTVPPDAKPQLTDIKPPILPDDTVHVEWDIPQKFPQEYINGVNKGEYHI